MPISKRKLAANRANAQKSTGPKSEAGKQAVSQNRVYHGLCGEFRVLSCETQSMFDDLVAEFLEAEKPVGAVERELVVKMAQHHWLAKRALRYQEACFVPQPQTPEQVATSMNSVALLNAIRIYMTYHAQHERAFHRVSAELAKRRKERAQAGVNILDESIRKAHTRVMVDGPKTLLEAAEHFKSVENCIRYLAAKRWPDGVAKCPTCGSVKVSFLKNQNKWQCSARHPKRQFSIKVGTIMEDSPIGLDKWLPVLWLIANCRNGISSWEVSRAIGVTQKTAWFMLHRVRLAMQDDFTGGMLGGEVEVDESFIGGKARNMHKHKREALKASKAQWETGNKTIVLGILERETDKKPRRIRTSIIPDRKRDTIAPEVQAHVESGSKVYSDDYGSIWGMNLGDRYIREMVSHFEKYVEGNVHTNTLENFWSLLKRGIGGTYVSVEPFHLFRYVDEQAFRYNNRKHADGEVIKDDERFGMLCSQIVGRRLTYQQLTGKEEQRPEEI